MRLHRRLLDQESGEGLAEYAILIALVAICLIGVIQVFRSAVGELLTTASTDVAKTSTSGYVPPGSMPVPPPPPRPSGGSGGSLGGSGGISGGWQGAHPEPNDSTAGDPELPDSLGVDSLEAQ